MAMLRAMAAVLFLLCGACDIGVVEGVDSESHGNPDPDAGSAAPGADVGGGGDAGAGGIADASVPDPAAGDCDQPVTDGLPSGKHNAGKACLSCHDGGGGAPEWTAAGTIYTTTAGAAPLPGATIHLVDADGNEVVVLTALNGNFWTSQALVYPITVRASRCPDTREMPGTLADTSANCNKSGCHDADMRIALP